MDKFFRVQLQNIPTLLQNDVKSYVQRPPTSLVKRHFRHFLFAVWILIRITQKSQQDPESLRINASPANLFKAQFTVTCYPLSAGVRGNRLRDWRHSLLRQHRPRTQVNVSNIICNANAKVALPISKSRQS